MDAKEVFEILVREHADMLITFIRAVVRDDDLAEDLFQETMLVAWRRLDQYDRDRPFAPWLRGIARRLILAEFRQNGRRFYTCHATVLNRLDALTAAVERQPGDQWHEKLSALEECLAGLPEPFRLAVELRYERELGQAQMAKQLQLSVAGVKKRLQRARERLFSCIERKLRLAQVPGAP